MVNSLPRLHSIGVSVQREKKIVNYLFGGVAAAGGILSKAVTTKHRCHLGIICASGESRGENPIMAPSNLAIDFGPHDVAPAECLDPSLICE